MINRTAPPTPLRNFSAFLGGMHLDLGLQVDVLGKFVPQSTLLLGQVRRGGREHQRTPAATEATWLTRLSISRPPFEEDYWML